MDHLSSKTPEMVEKEIWVHLLTFNIIRALMCQAAFLHQIKPRDLSFQGSRQIFEEFRTLASLILDINYQKLHFTMLNLIGQQRVGKRPGRYEPRAIKRRPKCGYRLLTLPRDKAKRKLWKRPMSQSYSKAIS